MPAFEVKLQGLSKMQRNLEPRYLIWSPMKKALRMLGKAGVDKGRMVGPRGPTQRLTSKMSYRINPQPAPRWVAIKTTATARRGFSYPRLLEFAPKWGHVNWFWDAIHSLKGAASTAVRMAQSDIRAKWGG